MLKDHQAAKLQVKYQFKFMAAKNFTGVLWHSARHFSSYVALCDTEGTKYKQVPDDYWMNTDPLHYHYINLTHQNSHPLVL